MAIEYTVQKKDGYLLIHSESFTDNPDELCEFVCKALQETETHNTPHLLIDGRAIQYAREFLGSYELAAQCVEQVKSDKPMRLAILARPDRMEFARIYESIGFMCGIEVKAFERPKLASVWLKGDS